ncbi:MAG TPA: imidazoleglycerol-phosphate dehydratase HisB [Clostridia bacterium]|jgi:imidazoleglycerol-phosphate dehydratase|nr:imidazoleglycerol-phosphate dehydratase HisB [Clostridia bacterium]
MRIFEIERKTKETKISLYINLDGSGNVKSKTRIGFFDHMITALGTHAGFDINLEVDGDLEVDCHHTVEDTGIVLGQAIRQAIGDGKGLTRFADCFLPMDEALGFAAIDISGRGFLSFEANFAYKNCGDYETDATPEFFRALAMNAGMTMHMKLLAGENDHHKIEALFKACARCLREALTIKGDKIPSSKGVI